MDRVLFGDNQFFGVNHMSEEKARAQQMRFQDLSAIIEVLDAAYATHPERFVRKPPQPPKLRPETWINQPDDTEEATQ